MRSFSRPAAFAVILALVLALVPAATASATLPVPPSTTQLNAVDFIDANNGWAAGGFFSLGVHYAVIERTTNGGTTWTRTTVRPPVGEILGISFVSTTVGYAVDGEPDRVFKTTDGGATWSELIVTTDLLDKNNSFQAVRFLDAQHGFVAGQHSGTKQAVVWATSNGGTTWSRVLVGPEHLDSEGNPIGDSWYQALDGYDASHVMAVGKDVILSSTPVMSALGSKYNGSVWATQTMPSTTKNFLGVVYPDASHALAVGPTGAAASFNGTSWTAVSPGTTNDLLGAAAADATHAWAVGTAGTIRFWNGSAFTPQTSGTSVTLNAVAAADATHAWAVGKNDTILKTTDGGAHWSLRVVTAPTVTVENIAGANRYETAVLAVQKAFPAGASTVVIAYGQNFPDALGGSAICGAWGAPLLLTQRDYLPTVVHDEITALHATHAIILGSESAVGPAVAQEIAGLVGGTTHVQRIGGIDRYDTAAQVATGTMSKLGASSISDVFLAVGDNFPDALAASPAAYDKKWPILLTRRTGLPSQTLDALKALKPLRVHVLGSSATVPDAVLDQLPAGITHDRWAGTTRYGTAVDVANKSGLPFTGIAIATGQNFPDALAGGVMQGKLRGPVLLTPTAYLATETNTWLTANKSQISVVRYLGSTTSVSTTVRTSVSNILK